MTPESLVQRLQCKLESGTKSIDRIMRNAILKTQKLTFLVGRYAQIWLTKKPPSHSSVFVVRTVSSSGKEIGISLNCLSWVLVIAWVQNYHGTYFHSTNWPDFCFVFKQCLLILVHPMVHGSVPGFSFCIWSFDSIDDIKTAIRAQACGPWSMLLFICPKNVYIFFLFLLLPLTPFFLCSPPCLSMSTFFFVAFFILSFQFWLLSTTLLRPFSSSCFFFLWFHSCVLHLHQIGFSAWVSSVQLPRLSLLPLEQLQFTHWWWGFKPDNLVSYGWKRYPQELVAHGSSILCLLSML